MPTSSLRGVYLPLITPFESDGSVALGAIERLAHECLDAGAAGLVPLGTTGESPFLDAAEKRSIVELCAAIGRERDVHVIVGVGTNNTPNTIAAAEALADVPGVTHALVVVPYYVRPSQAGIVAHMKAVAAASPVPLVLYNIPGRTGVTMSAQTVAKLSQHQNIVAIKEATGSLDMTSEIASLCHLPILSGDDSLTLPIMSLGGRGVISVISNLLPSKVKQMVKHAQDGNYAEARAIHYQLFPLIKAIFLDGNPVGIKHAMKIAGMDSGELRLPLAEASEATKKQIELFMAPAGAPFAV